MFTDTEIQQARERIHDYHDGRAYSLPPTVQDAQVVPIPRDIVSMWLLYSEDACPFADPHRFLWDLRRLVDGDPAFLDEEVVPFLQAWTSKNEDYERLWAEADRPYREDDVLVLEDLASIFHNPSNHGLWALYERTEPTEEESAALIRLQILFSELDKAELDQLDIVTGVTNPTAVVALLAKGPLTITEEDLKTLTIRDRFNVESEIIQARYVAQKEQEKMAQILEYPKQPKPPRYVFETISDLRKLPAAKWLVDGWIPEEGIGLIYGEYAHGKSFVGFDLLLHLAYGLPEWHGAKLPGGPCDVLLIAREGSMGFKGRIDAFKAHHGISEDADRIIFMRSPANLGDAAQFEELKTAVRATGKQFKVVMVDTVGRALPGEDFFDPKSITGFMERLQQLGEVGRGVAIGVHHVNKSGDLFGSIYFGASSDFMFLVEREGDSKKHPLTRGRITCTKMKDGEDGWKKRVDYQKAASSLVIASIAEAGDILGETKKLSDADKLALQALGNALKTVGKLRAEMPGRSVTIDDWLDHCFKIGGVDPTAAKPKRDLHRRQVKLLANGLILVQDQLVRPIGHSSSDVAIPRGAPGSVCLPLPPTT